MATEANGRHKKIGRQRLQEVSETCETQEVENVGAEGINGSSWEMVVGDWNADAEGVMLESASVGEVLGERKLEE